MAPVAMMERFAAWIVSKKVDLILSHYLVNRGTFQSVEEKLFWGNIGQW